MLQIIKGESWSKFKKSCLTSTSMKLSVHFTILITEILHLLASNIQFSFKEHFANEFLIQLRGCL